MNKICLVMIVRNEERVIRRCLESVKHIVDSYVIVDTGSTDDTWREISDTLQGCEVAWHQRPWKNFGHNRSEAMDLAQGKGDYYLLLDADMVLQDHGFDKDSLTDDSYYLKQYNKNLIYSNLRLLKAGLPWKCIGVTHEYWIGSEHFTHLSTLSINDVSDGGSKEGKFRRDIELLVQGLEEEPDNARYMFYLANSFRDIGHFEKAIRWYNERIAAGGWDEEVWHAMYQKGVCRIKNHEPLEVILNDLMAAFNVRPWRIEPLHALVKHLNSLEVYHAAYWIGRMLGMLNTHPSTDILFIERDVYDHKFYAEMRLASEMTGHKDDAAEYEKRLTNHLVTT